MLDVDPAKLTRLGTVTITSDGIVVSGFQGKGTSCRDVAALAALWAIGELQRELRKTLEAPGNNNIAIG